MMYLAERPFRSFMGSLPVYWKAYPGKNVLSKKALSKLGNEAHHMGKATTK